MTGYNYGNGVAAIFGFSPDRLQLTSLSYTQGVNTLFSLNYGYGAAGSNNGQMLSITDNVDAGRTVNYTYDALYRVKRLLAPTTPVPPNWSNRDCGNLGFGARSVNGGVLGLDRGQSSALAARPTATGLRSM